VVHGIFLTGIGLWLAVAAFHSRILPGLILAWCALTFLAVGTAYFTRCHRVFGKRADGTLPRWSKLLFFPFLTFNHVVWSWQWRLARKAATSIVDPDLVMGRRLRNHEVHGDFANYVDLTAEFEEPLAARSLPGYLSLPILDGSAPSAVALAKNLSQLRPGRTYVHCAQGYGRAGLFALAWLISRGKAASIEEGLQMLRQARPNVRLNHEQAACVGEFFRNNY
jgi:protein-tyrosine phosphatase